MRIQFTGGSADFPAFLSTLTANQTSTPAMTVADLKTK